MDGQRPAATVPVGRENVVTRPGQKTLVVLTEDSVGSTSEVVAVAVPVDIRSVQVTSNARS